MKHSHVFVLGFAAFFVAKLVNSIFTNWLGVNLGSL